ncbi:MAG: RNA polymerase sigma factor [Balneolaceae bacterium]
MDITEKNFTEIIEANEERLKHLSRMYADRIDDEQDIYQEIIIQIWRSLPSFEGDAQINTWIYRLAVNTAISFTRKKRTRQAYYSKFKKQKKSEKNTRIYPDSPEKDKVTTLYDAMAALNPSEKAIISMYLEDFSYEEIAFVTDISENYVGVKLHRIKNKLSNIIKEENGA